MYNFNMQTIVFNCSNILVSFKAYCTHILYFQIIHYNLNKLDMLWGSVWEYHNTIDNLLYAGEITPHLYCVVLVWQENWKTSSINFCNKKLYAKSKCRYITIAFKVKQLYSAATNMRHGSCVPFDKYWCWITTQSNEMSYFVVVVVMPLHTSTDY